MSDIQRELGLYGKSIDVIGGLDEFYIDGSEPLDILVCTPEEFEEMKEGPFGTKMAHTLGAISSSWVYHESCTFLCGDRPVVLLGPYS